ncbi:hypothetical protein GF373_12740 [bacterium]|nr:hypothetical protein [bacterium]
MTFVIRKIEINKWMQTPILQGQSPSADAITNCMKTTNNTLSLWDIQDENEVEDAVLAIASQLDHLDTFDILVIEKSLIQEKALSLKSTEGKTPYKDFSNRHIDVANLDLDSLGRMAKVIIESIRQNRQKRFTTSNLKRILADGIIQGKIQKTDIKENLLRKLPNQ